MSLEDADVLELFVRNMDDMLEEGIESDVHIEYLEKTGCKYGQGFLFDPGLSTKDIEKLFKKQKSSYL